jgi:hypothetical protein
MGKTITQQLRDAANRLGWTFRQNGKLDDKNRPLWQFVDNKSRVILADNKTLLESITIIRQAETC